MYGEKGLRGIGGTISGCDAGDCQMSMGNWSTKTWDFKVFNTDYENYQIKYGCWEWNGKAHEMFSVNSRTPTMDDATMQTVKDIVRERLPAYAEFIANSSNIYFPTQGDSCNYDWKLSVLPEDDANSFLQP